MLNNNKRIEKNKSKVQLKIKKYNSFQSNKIIRNQIKYPQIIPIGNASIKGH